MLRPSCELSVPGDRGLKSGSMAALKRLCAKGLPAPVQADTVHNHAVFKSKRQLYLSVGHINRY